MKTIVGRVAMSDIKVTAEGNMSRVEPMNGEYYERAELQSHCGGGIKLYRTNDKYIIWNANGEELALPYNGLATNWLYEAHYNWDNARGTALLVSADHIDPTKLLDTVEFTNNK